MNNNDKIVHKICDCLRELRKQLWLFAINSSTGNGNKHVLKLKVLKIQARLADFEWLWLGKRLLPREDFVVIKLRLNMMQ
jgi:hypothetical protein